MPRLLRGLQILRKRSKDTNVTKHIDVKKAVFVQKLKIIEPVLPIGMTSNLLADWVYRNNALVMPLFMYIMSATARLVKQVFVAFFMPLTLHTT